jgi:DNA-binding response OmpR family regulator
MRKHHILVLDDSPLVLEIVRVSLERAGYTVTTAGNLEELEAERARCKPDLLLMDIQMPEAYGDDVAMVLRAVRGVEIPIILFSSIDADKLGHRIKDAEVDAFVPKRAGIEAVIAQIRTILRQAVTHAEG